MNAGLAINGAGSAPSRVRTAVISSVVGLIVVMVFHYSLPEGPAVILLDRGGFGYPFSVQNTQWIVFFIGIGELVVRYRWTKLDLAQLRSGLLPEDASTVLKMHDLGALYERARNAPTEGSAFLPRIIQRIVLQCQTTRSADQASSFLTATLDLNLHEIDLHYNMLRYIMWVIPSLGFLGTVEGIALALNFAGDPAQAENPAMLSEVTARLAVAFNTTLVALVMASLIVFATNIIQTREERVLNESGQYCFDHLINRLFLR